MPSNAIEVDDPLWDEMMSVMRRKEVISRTAPSSVCAFASGRCEHCAAALQLQQDDPQEQDEDTAEVRDGNVVCRRCNTVLGRQLDYGAEWRYYGSEDTAAANNPTRCCPPSNGLIASLGGVISGAPRRRASSWSNRTEASAAAAQASSRAGRSIQRMQVWSSMSHKDRVLCGVFETLSVNASHHGLPSCILEDAKTLYKRVSEAKITRGENRCAVIAVSVYVACKRCGVPRTLKEVAVMFDMRVAALTKACKSFQAVVHDADAATTTPADLVGRFCSRLGMDRVAVEATRAVVARADELAIVCDAMPTSIVAGALQLVSKELGLGIGAEAVAAVCDVAPATVTKMFRRLSNVVL